MPPYGKNKLGRVYLTISLSPETLEILDSIAAQHAWKRPQALDYILLRFQEREMDEDNRKD